jgi:hypothetical protein
LTKHGYWPRGKQSLRADAASAEEKKIGRWANSLGERQTFENTGQKKLFNRLKKTTPTFVQKNNADNLAKWQGFIARQGYAPRHEISVLERAKMTEAAYNEEIALGKWANNASNTTPDWQYPEQQQAAFVALLNKTPTFWQKQNTEMLVLFKDFCRQYGYRPRVKDRRGEVSELEHKAFKWGNNAKNRGADFQYPEQQNEFDEIYHKYPTYQQYMKKLEHKPAPAV